jgi:hypothetical protein
MNAPRPAAKIILVNEAQDFDADGVQDDQGLIDWLVAEGHDVDVQPSNWLELDDDKIAALNAADLIIVSRTSGSGGYDDGEEPTQWNSIETPMILMNAYITRNSRWLWVDSGSVTSPVAPLMLAVLPDHPIFEGVAVDADGIVLAVDGAVGSGQTSFVEGAVGNGTLIAETLEGYPWIAQWEAGVEFYDGAGQVPAAARMMLTAGTQEPPTWGEQNLTEDGLQILRNAINIMLASGAAPAAGPPELTAAFAFGSRQLDCATYNDPTVNYTMVLHDSVESVQYDAARGYGYEVVYPADSPFGDRGGYGVFGPFDNSPNNRNRFGDECPEELYDSFIGAKDFSSEVSAVTMGDMDTPSPNPEGIIFRVDVPNGMYRFVAAVGEADNVHAARVLAEDGGSGPPENIGANHVVLVHNHDQAQQTIGEATADEPGEGVFARVGFDGLIPPMGDGVFPDPQFIDMDDNGMPADAANSPVLEVTQGYIRIHQLQGNSNDGPGGPKDVNGGDIVILELWKVD